MNGKIKLFKKDRGFGFIAASNQVEYFFHISQVKNELIPGVGDSVVFELGVGRAGKPVAKEVQITERATPVSRSPYYGKPKMVDVHPPGREVGAALGALLGAAGGPLGVVAGAFLGAATGRAIGNRKVMYQVEMTSTCLRCGGVGQVTSETDTRYGFQCSKCHKFWSRPRAQAEAEFRKANGLKPM